jgi:hypothetical protein
LTLDTSDNVAITEYAMVGTNGSLGSVSADVNGSDVRLRVATLNNNLNSGCCWNTFKVIKKLNKRGSGNLGNSQQGLQG